MSIRKRLPVAVGGLAAVAALGLGSTLAFGGEHDANRALAAQLKPGKAKNVIFFLGDGMGTQEITAARYYRYGAAGRMHVDRLPFTGFQTTWSVKPADKAPFAPDYDPDSASTGTMWASGIKTLDERISQGPSASIDIPGDNSVKTVLELAQAAGKKTGNVTTAELTDATPAVLDSHISLRGCQGPADADAACKLETKAAGGLGSIAEQTVDHRVDVLLGGGRARFAQTITGGRDKGKTVEQSAARLGYTQVRDAAGLAALRKRDRPVLGLFADGTMTTEWTGPAATLGDGTPAARCTTGNRPAAEPSLPAMTKKAIELLEGSKQGFFLQVEGASIDKQDHAANACGQIGETVALDDAIGVALAFQKTHPDTLVVVTADHAHTSQIVDEDSTGAGNPTGYSNNLITKDGQVMRVTYGTAGGNPAAASAPSQQHTGSVVPVWAGGPQGAAVLGTTDHTALYPLLQGDRGRRQAR
jgi:alkaline phosphatase